MTTEHPSPAHDQPADGDDDPEFGPGGYLPERASRRARKIVLRAPLGLQWIAGAVVAGVLVVVAGILFLATATDPPGPPYREVGRLDDLAHADRVVCPGDLDCADAVLSREAGRPRVLTTAGAALTWCVASRHFESSSGDVWTATGRGLGVPSLDEHPSVVVSGVLYVDWTTTITGPPAEPEPVAPACTDAALRS